MGWVVDSDKQTLIQIEFSRIFFAWWWHISSKKKWMSSYPRSSYHFNLCLLIRYFMVFYLHVIYIYTHILTHDSTPFQHLLVVKRGTFPSIKQTHTRRYATSWRTAKRAAPCARAWRFCGKSGPGEPPVRPKILRSPVCLLECCRGERWWSFFLKYIFVLPALGGKRRVNQSKMVMCCWCCCALEVLITFSLIIFLYYFYHPTGTEPRTSLRALKCWTAFSNLGRKVTLGLITYIYVHMTWHHTFICVEVKIPLFSCHTRLSSTSFDRPCHVVHAKHRLENYFGDAEAVRRATSFRDSATWQFDGG